MSISDRLRVLALLAVACWCAPGSAAAPGVYKDRIEPHWFADNSRFWYRNALRGDAVEFILVDAEKGTRQPAFDHDRAAAALGRLTGAAVKPDHLPVRELDFEPDGGAVLLRGVGESWRLDLKTYQAAPASPADPAATAATSLRLLPRPRPSRAGGAETSIQFVNRTAGPVSLSWIDTDGNPKHYATLDAGGRWEQQTYAGHVWIATDAAGKTLGVYEATDRAGTAVVGAPVAAPTGAPVDAKADPTTAPTTHAARPASRRGSGTRGPVSPDGKWFITLDGANLVLHDKADATRFPLSRDGKPGDGYSPDRVWWSPDSSRFVALRVEAGQEHKIYTVESSPKDQLQPKLRTLDYLKAGDRIDHPRPRLFDVATRAAVPISDELFQNPWSLTDLRWAADSSRFTFLYNQRGHQALRVVAVDARDGSARAVVDEWSDTFIDYSGKQFCHWVGDDELIWMSERDGWNHLWLFDAKAGKPGGVIGALGGGGEYVVQKVLRVDEPRRRVWFTAGGVRPGQDPYYSHLCRADFDGKDLTVLTEANGTHTVQWSPDERFLIDTWSRVDQPPVTELRNGDTGKLVCRLEEADAAEALAARGGRWPEPFTAKGRDGKTDIYGIIHYPRDFDPSKKYPVVEQIYAGPQDFFTPKAFRAHYGTAEKIADRGVVVVQCDGMGTSGRSKAFHDVCWKNLRDAGFPDRIPWITAAAATRPSMDLSRVGVYGGSAGGQNAMAALLWHHDFYKVAVADCGCHDNRMDKIWWNEQWMGWPVGKEYAENSNAVNAKLLEGKLMLIFGELDDNVDPSSTMQVVDALEKADKDFELVVVTGAKHGSAETPYGSKRRAEFLLRNLRVGQ